MSTLDVLLAGEWCPSLGTESFVAVDPRTGHRLGEYPISPWAEIDRALDAGFQAFEELRELGPEPIARFLDRYADRIDASAGELADTAHRETALARRPRLAEVELPRTSDQLRQAATAARDRSWTRPTLSPAQQIASMLVPIPGVVAVFGPNNFPFAFNGASGGDFAAAIATGHPVLAKANPGHPGTTRLLADHAHKAAVEEGLPPATVQLVYRTSHPDGARLVADHRLAATGYTGSRRAGMALKAAADEAGKPIYLEMSSVNPVVVLPGAWEERGEQIADELTASMLQGWGQFCTSPGLLFTISGAHAGEMREVIGARLVATPAEALLGPGVVRDLEDTRTLWREAGASVVAQSETLGDSCTFPSTLMWVTDDTFLANSTILQQEAFGNMSLMVEAADIEALIACLSSLGGNLTGSVYSSADGTDDHAYAAVEQVLRRRVGRLLNDKVPTGVAVVPAMNHGGPYPATGHPGFTSVGIPASLARFGMLQCFDHVRVERLPLELQPSNPLGLMRYVDNRWTTSSTIWGVQ